MTAQSVPVNIVLTQYFNCYTLWRRTQSLSLTTSIPGFQLYNIARVDAREEEEEEEQDRKMDQEIILNSGHRMPLLAMGTATYPSSPAELVETSVISAIELGYRHFDSARVYQSEQPLGRAISEALSGGIIGSREEIFITTKLWPAHACPDRVQSTLRESLESLNLDYVDLYLIHFPARFRSTDFSIDMTNVEVLPFDLKGTWEAMEECCRLGLAKSIGVSNFSCKKLSQLLDSATIPPAVNQVEMHPLWQQQKLREFCAQKNIHVSAYSPLGGKESPWGSNAVFDSDEIRKIAQAKGRSIAQICLRWGLEQGVSIIVKSFNKERLRENMEIFDWCLTQEELQKMSVLPQKRIVGWRDLISPDGQFKSFSELWDGEI